MDIKLLVNKIISGNFEFSEEFLIKIRIGEHLLWKKAKTEKNIKVAECFYIDFYKHLLKELNFNLPIPDFKILKIDKYKKSDKEGFYIGGFFSYPNKIRMYVENNEFGHGTSFTAIHEFCHYIDYLDRGFTNHDKHFKKLDYYGLEAQAIKTPKTLKESWDYPVFNCL